MFNMKFVEMKTKEKTREGEKAFLALAEEIQRLSVVQSESSLGATLRSLLLELSSREGQTQNDLVETLSLSKPTVSLALKKLEEKEFVKRETDEYDRRAARVFLTEKGKETARNLQSQLREQEAKAFRGFTTNEREQLVKLLARVKENLKNE